jgi:hypothetical protein
MIAIMKATNLINAIILTTVTMVPKETMVNVANRVAV